MEHLSRTLFLWLNASEHPNAFVVTLATFFAQWLIWAIPTLIGIGWLRGKEETRKTMLVVTAASMMGLLINQLIGLVWSHPRPFMIGLGHTLIQHAADSSFPSDHLTLWWAAALSFRLHSGLRRVGIALALMGAPIAWARIYLGVHFPLDMLGAFAVATCGAWSTLRATAWYLEASYQLASRIHRTLFGRLITLGWVRD